MSTNSNPFAAAQPIPAQPNQALLSFIQAAAPYFPLVQTGITAVQQAIPDAPNEMKAQTASDIVLALAKTTEQFPNPNVALIAALIDFGVSIAKAKGLFAQIDKANQEMATATSAHPGFLFAFAHPHIAARERDAAKLPAASAPAIGPTNPPIDPVK